MNRRTFLKNSAAVTAGLSLPLSARASPQQANKKVIVLGAGLAGLTAAWELVQAGHEVIVLEARHRYGGRILTLREGFTSGLTAEAGGMAFNDNYFNLFRYIKLFNIPYESLATPAIQSPAGNRVYHLRGKRLVANKGKVDWPYDLTPEERAGNIGRRYIHPLADSLKDASISDALTDWARSLDHKTLLQLVAERGASPGAQEVLKATGNLERDGKASAAWDLLPMAQGASSRDLYGFPGGSDLLTTAFAVRLGERIRYGAEVKSMQHDANGVEVLVKTAGKQESISADRVVCTIPFSVLRNIHISPALPAFKKEIVSGMYYQPVTRVFLEVRKRFWENKGENGFAYTDLPIGHVEDHPMIKTGGEKDRGILEAHVRGLDALEMDKLSGDKRMSFALEHINKIHPGMYEHYEGGISKSWQQDPYSLGGYAMFLPGQITSWLPEIVRPEGRIHFAGEHTSIYAGSMEGAIESGIRAAKEIGTF